MRGGPNKGSRGTGVRSSNPEGHPKPLDDPSIPSAEMVDLRTEYAGVAAKMSTYGVQAIELNLSCPHAKGLGTEIAQDEAAVRDFTREVKDVVDIPVFPKLSPNVQDIAKFAVAAEEGGADAIVAINTMKAMAITPELKMPSLG